MSPTIKNTQLCTKVFPRTNDASEEYTPAIPPIERGTCCDRRNFQNLTGRNFGLLTHVLRSNPMNECLLTLMEP